MAHMIPPIPPCTPKPEAPIHPHRGSHIPEKIGVLECIQRAGVTGKRAGSACTSHVPLGWVPGTVSQHGTAQHGTAGQGWARHITWCDGRGGTGRGEGGWSCESPLPAPPSTLDFASRACLGQ